MPSRTTGRTAGSADTIRIRGARQNNLKQIDVDIPRNRMTVITGVSGSGKSSLAFDTLYSEGQRLYVETFSAYTRQFLDRMDRPAVDRVEGIPPAIAIDQTNPVRTSRSTVGTMTELNDHLKLLYARAASLSCRGCGRPVRRDTPDSIHADLTGRLGERQVRLVVAFPVPAPTTLSDEEVADLVRSQGYRGVLERNESAVLVIQDRIRWPEAARERLIEDLEQALARGRGRCSVHELADTAEYRYSADLHCAECDIHYRDPVPNLFSFNSPIGACPTCRGFGRVIGIDWGLVVPDESLSLKGGAVKPWQSKSYDECRRDLLRYARRRGIPVDVPWKNLSDEARSWVIDGEGDWQEGVWYGAKRFFDWLEGRSYKMHIRVLLSRYRAYRTCPDCSGARLKPEALLWRIRSPEDTGAPGGRTIHEVLLEPISSLVRFFDSIGAHNDEATESVLSEIRRRLGYLEEVGLGYLNLDRQSRTLSGGEVQRVNLTTALGTALVNALFVLDEPSIGLHPRDVDRLVGVLHRLRDSGNTIVVVEHDPEVIAGADHVIDLGPGAGAAGGSIVFQGTPAALRRDRSSLTGAYLSGRRSVTARAGAAAGAAGRPAGSAVPPGGSRALAGEAEPRFLTIHGAEEHNLAGIDVAIPLNRTVVLTGVSGSGKSTLMVDVLHRALLRRFGRATEEPGRHAAISGADALTDVVLVDQSAIGKSARSNPASYVGAFDVIRGLFARADSARERGYTAGTFSFNSAGGQCPACKGSGFEHIEMQFLSDVYLRCPDCNGRRFRAEVLEVRLPGDPDAGTGLSIADVLDLTVDEATALFADEPKVVAALAPLSGVGLGYVTLGQPVPTLSGGEAQRLKLASHLARGYTRPGGSDHVLFLFDEPTTGLHFRDIATLLSAFARLQEAGHSLVIIEHNLDVIAAADWVIDLGPEGGEAGGRLQFSGTPASLVASSTHTGAALAGRGATRPAPGGRPPATTSRGRTIARRVDRIQVRGAREHNLKGVDIDIPHDRFTVLTGVSGSGKSTIAFDIIFAEGQRRYLESLNAYTRQFVQPASRPDMDGALGIPPSVAIEQRTSRGGQKSTVATTTEIYQYLRLLYSKVGTQHCPDCGVPIEEQTEQTILESITRLHRGRQVVLLAPLVTGRKGYYTDLARWASRKGHGLLRVDGTMIPTDAWPRLDRYREHDIELPIGPVGGAGLPAALHEAIHHGNGVVRVARASKGGVDAGSITSFSTVASCPTCSRSFEPLDPRLFSFNSRHGWCPACLGTGTRLTRAEQRLLEESVGWDGLTERSAPCPVCGGRRLRPEALSVRFRDRSIAELAALSVGEARSFFTGMELTGREQEIARDLLAEMGSRLRFLEEVGLGYLTLDRSAPTLSGGEAQRIRLAAQLGSDLRGVCYVLDEPTIGLHPRDNRMLLGVLRRLTAKGNTVLVVEHDEETIREADYVVDLGPGGGVEGGRVVARGTVEEIVANRESVTGAWLRRSPQSRLLQFTAGSSGEPRLSVRPGEAERGEGVAETAPALRRGDDRTVVRSEGRSLRVAGAYLHNLIDLDVSIPLGALTCVTGVSGSGKSTLVRDVIYASVAGALSRTRRRGRSVGCRSIDGIHAIERVLEVDQTPIGKTPRSTPATYIGVWDEIRRLFAALPESRMRGYTASRFSFNTADGRCEACAGQGLQRIEMSFLPDVTVLCEECRGRRFTPETLSVEFRGRSIADVLAMDVDEAAAFFSSQPKIRHSLELLVDVGLGYLTLGQQSPTLSGGEAQRIKLVSELARSSTTAESLARRRSGLAAVAPSALYLLDEPTVGLHMADVEQLVRVLRRLVDTGATVLVIEHNLDLIRAADHIIDLGPEGGSAGGRLVVAGTPAEVAAHPGSHTGAFLRDGFAQQDDLRHAVGGG